MDNSNSRYKKRPVANSDENVLREENDDGRETVMQLQLFSALYIGRYKVQGMSVASINLNRPFLIDTTPYLQKKGHQIYDTSVSTSCPLIVSFLSVVELNVELKC